jgi:hypothetical protein
VRGHGEQWSDAREGWSSGRWWESHAHAQTLLLPPPPPVKCVSKTGQKLVKSGPAEPFYQHLTIILFGRSGAGGPVEPEAGPQRDRARLPRRRRRRQEAVSPV